MKTIVLSGSIGSGKSTRLKNTNFLKKFQQPVRVISVDALGADARNSEISHQKFLENPYMRRFVSCSGHVYKNLLKKHLFFALNRKILWNILEKIIHPQIRQKIVSIQNKNSQKKGTLVFECPIPQLLFPEISQKNVLHISCRQKSQKFLRLMRHRKMRPREISEILMRQKI